MQHSVTAKTSPNGLSIEIKYENDKFYAIIYDGHKPCRTSEGFHTEAAASLAANVLLSKNRDILGLMS